MPRRLRVRFEAQQFLMLPCASGAFTRTGQAATLGYVPLSVSEDVWTKISTYAMVGDSRSGPNIGQGWTKSAISTLTGKVFLAQNQPTDPQGGTFFFNPSLGYWERTNAVTGDWHRNPLGIMENYDMTFDPDLDCFYRSSGGPFGGTPYNTAGPFYGDSKYNVATDEWSTPYPESGCTYTALPADAGYFGTPGNSLTGFDSSYNYYNGAIYQFGNYSVGGSQSLKKRVISTGVITTLVAYPSVPPWTNNARTPHLRSGFDTRTKKLWTLADVMAYWTCDLTAASPSWTAVTTTGDHPSVPAPSGAPTYADGDFGMLAIVDEAANCLVAWCGTNGTVQAHGGTAQRKTWIMDLATRVWRVGPSHAAGDTTPTAAVAVLNSLLYDSVNRRTVLTVGTGGYTEVWALNIAPIGGKITSWALPTSSGSTYGTNYYGFPFTANGSCKHVNMAYCPQDGRLYATGGDSIYSATDGLWSMSLDDGSWRMDVGQPSYPTLAAPHAYQDGCLFEWMPSRNKFLFGFGGVFGYEADGSAVYNYSSGYWMYDPIAGTWEQVAAFFTNPTLSHAVSGTGNDFGGTYDDVTDTVYVLGDASGTASARRYNIGTGVQDSSISYTIPPSGESGFVVAYFQRSKQCKLGRYIYALGYYTNGVSTAPANVRPAMFRYGIDDQTFTKMTAPPQFTQNVSESNLVLCVSGSKLVHPRKYGPDGPMPEGIYVYNPANDTWTTDTKTPAYGNWIQNSVCSLTDGRVAMSGGVFGAQQTHMWFYEAT